MYTADIDIGGTFTDGFFTDGTDWQRAKVLTTPHDLTECFLNCLKEGAARFGVPFKEFLRRSAVVRLSTTLGTNTLIQRRGPKIGLLVTHGHEDDLYGQGEAAVLRRFLAPEMVIGIREQVDDQGRAVLAPEPREVLAAVRRLIDLGARLIAVSFANSWRNPAHERLVRTIVRERYPEHYLRSIPLQLSHEVSVASDDHVRTNTAVLNAYLHRELARGLYRSEDVARDSGMTHPLLVVHASGGCARVAKTVAIQTLSSGPAVAVRGAAVLARKLGLDRVVTMDMGGTSLDVAVLHDASPTIVQTPYIAGIPLAFPMVETESIGAGGGSIARVADGRLLVGPESAGSAPGPACYDKGGMEPTVTDANLVLGFLDPDRFLGGRMKLNRKRAEDALARRIGRLLGETVTRSAAAIRARVNEMMAAEIAARVRAKGEDPAAYTLFAFGGGGPLHGCAIAERVGIRRVIGFPFGSVFSAFGSSTVDVRHMYWRTLVAPLATEDLSDRLRTTVAELEHQALLDMRGEGFDPSQVRFQVMLVLRTLDGERRVPWQESDDAGARAILAQTSRTGSKAVDTAELRAVTLEAWAETWHWTPTAVSEQLYQPEIRERRSVYWDQTAEFLETPLYRYYDLRPGAMLSGPAIIEAEDTSYVVNPGWHARLDGWGNVVLER
ncbi:MAG TPA: hydantoinase/oxoprolinase family protein [Chloroflexota bacterium]|nr:hydantoinase/oxoprolinase family protein [Chloroflexota bacterium]